MAVAAGSIMQAVKRKRKCITKCWAQRSGTQPSLFFFSSRAEGFLSFQPVGLSTVEEFCLSPALSLSRSLAPSTVQLHLPRPFQSFAMTSAAVEQFSPGPGTVRAGLCRGAAFVDIGWIVHGWASWGGRRQRMWADVRMRDSERAWRAASVWNASLVAASSADYRA